MVPPYRELAVAVVGGAVRDGIGPVLEHGLDEALGFAINLHVPRTTDEWDTS